MRKRFKLLKDSNRTPPSPTARAKQSAPLRANI
jgi:hypothetical protein